MRVTEPQFVIITWPQFGVSVQLNYSIGDDFIRPAN